MRREGWEGEILLFDADPLLPYHRPPLSKAYLNSDGDLAAHVLMPAERYEHERITLHLGMSVSAINRREKYITLSDGSRQVYDKLVIATGARPFILPIPGVDTAHNLFPVRTASDAIGIRHAIQASEQKRVLIIGGGYIGLETAASLQKLGASVTVLECEERVLARVTAPALSDFFQQLHAEKGVEILTHKNVVAIETTEEQNEVVCADGTRYKADIIIMGVGIRVNTELAEAAGLAIENGIRVDASSRTNDESIYAIGDCTFHHNLTL